MIEVACILLGGGLVIGFQRAQAWWRDRPLPIAATDEQTAAHSLGYDERRVVVRR